MNSKSKDRLKQQMRLFEKIFKLLKGKVSENTISYLFMLHLLSGINQSRQAGLNPFEYRDAIDFQQVNTYFDLFIKQKSIFFTNEHSNLFGKLRLDCFLLLMKNKKYVLAGYIMGLH